MFKVSPASPLTFIDTQNSVLEDRVQYTTVIIPNVFCDDHPDRQLCGDYSNMLWQVKVNQSRYKPGVVLRFPGI